MCSHAISKAVQALEAAVADADKAYAALQQLQEALPSGATAEAQQEQNAGV